MGRLIQSELRGILMQTGPNQYKIEGLPRDIARLLVEIWLHGIRGNQWLLVLVLK